MEGRILDAQRSVLIVDDSEETREVLQTALQRCGLRTFAAERAAPGLELARRCQPDLVVLDLELDHSGPESLSSAFAQQLRANHTPLVMLGTLRRGQSDLLDGEFVAKPYHYGPLIRKIQKLLDTTSRSSAQSV
jgi:DNA-binding response OmpR family regulator